MSKKNLRNEKIFVPLQRRLAQGVGLTAEAEKACDCLREPRKFKIRQCEQDYEPRMCYA